MNFRLFSAFVWVLGGLACGEDDACEPMPDMACRGPSSQGDGFGTAANDGDDAGTNGADAAATAGTDADDGPNEEGSNDDQPQGETSDARGDTMSSEDGGTDTSTGDPGPADDCAGLEEDACYAQSRLGNCEPIWGVPWIDVDGEWCLFPNGSEYLGCAVAEGCEDATLTVCNPDTGATWDLGKTCLPSDLPVVECAPPGDCVY